MQTMTSSGGNGNVETDWQTDSHVPRRLRKVILAALLALQLWSAGLSFCFFSLSVARPYFNRQDSLSRDVIDDQLRKPK